MVEHIHFLPVRICDTSPLAGGGPLFHHIQGATTNPDHNWAIVYQEEHHQLKLVVDGKWYPIDGYTLYDCLNAIAHLDDPHWPPPRRDYADYPLTPEEEEEREYPLGRHDGTTPPQKPKRERARTALKKKTPDPE